MQLQTVLGSQLAQEAERSNGAADGANEMREIADSVNDLSTAVLSAPISRALASKWNAAWRCDLHPAWDRSYSWLALNGRPSGGARQVLIAYMGAGAGMNESLTRFFPPAKEKPRRLPRARPGP